MKESKIIAQGRTSVILKLDNYKVVKKLKPNATRKNLAKEYLILRLLEPFNIAPRAFQLRDDELVMEYIPGKSLKDFLASESEEKKKKVLTKLVHRAAILDLLGIAHNQLHIGKNVLVTEKLEVYIIDFEKATLGSSAAKNVGQVVGYYLYPQISPEMRQKLRKLLKFWKRLVKEIHSSRSDQDSWLRELQGSEGQGKNLSKPRND
jgi:predicted Ser/Thr protein kinase